MGTYVFRDFTQIPKETALQLIVSLDAGHWTNKREQLSRRIKKIGHFARRRRKLRNATLWLVLVHALRSIVKVV